MYRFARQILFALLGFAIISGSNPLLAMHARPFDPTTMIDMPCDMEMSGMGTGHEKPTQPCDSMAHDCIKHMCCVTISVPPADLPIHETAVEYSVVAYWASASKLAGVDREPEHFPPRTA